MWNAGVSSFLFLIVLAISKVDSNQQNITKVHEDEFSLSPSNTPISKVYILGRSLYLRLPFVLPKRSVDLNALNLPRQAPAYAPLLAEDVPSVPVNPSGYETNGVLKTLSSYSTAPTLYVPPPTKPPSQYPLPQCYTNENGFMCCNCRLEKVMKDAVDELRKEPGWKNCNVQKIANKIQEKAEAEFATSFESIAAVGDFASKMHFYSDYICKIEREGRFMLAYGTPRRPRVPAPQAHPTPSYIVNSSTPATSSQGYDLS